MPELSYSVFDMVVCFAVGLAAGVFGYWFLNLDLNILFERWYRKYGK